jgi:hypothetical protein
MAPEGINEPTWCSKIIEILLVFESGQTSHNRGRKVRGLRFLKSFDLLS